jgi:hypothetical protein
MYIKLVDNKPITYSIEQLRQDNNNVSFPDTISPELLQEYNIYNITALPTPDYDEFTHYLKQSDFYQVDGVWRVHYTPERLAESTAGENVRNERNRLLSESDWVVTKRYETQTPIPQEWVQYRQALRDIPQQADFPYDIIWPSLPNLT